MKILYVITRSERGGAQIHLLDLLTNLPAGCCPVLATGEAGYLCDETKKLGIPVHIVRHLRQPISPIDDSRALVEIVRLIRSESPDLIHAHTSKAGLLARLAGWITNTPTVFTAHTWSFVDGVSSFRRRIAIPLERLGGWTGGKVITVSKANTEIAVRNSIADEKNLLTIWNGIPDVSPRSRPGASNIPAVIMVARFAPQKDQLSLIAALAGIETPWRLILVGDGPTRADIEREVVDRSLTGRVTFLGDRNDIPDLLAQADLFVLSTNWEGLPLSILEAMRAGLPVIATSVGGCAEAVTDGVTGFLTRAGDVAHLRQKIEALLSSKTLLRSMGKAGRERFHQDFRIESMMEKLLGVYRSVVPQHFDRGAMPGALSFKPPERLAR